jgi:hypothetical protein
MPNTTPAQITEEAIRIIAGAPEYGPLQPVEYAKALPPRARGASARVLRQGDHNGCRKVPSC